MMNKTTDPVVGDQVYAMLKLVWWRPETPGRYAGGRYVGRITTWGCPHVAEVRVTVTCFQDWIDTVWEKDSNYRREKGVWRETYRGSSFGAPLRDLVQKSLLTHGLDYDDVRLEWSVARHIDD